MCHKFVRGLMVDRLIINCLNVNHLAVNSVVTGDANIDRS